MIETIEKTDELIKVDNLYLTLMADSGPVEILKGINLDLKSGEGVSITGPSGSGKTSLLMLLAGLERPTKGNINVAGVDYSGLNEDALARFRRDHIGIVFQNFHLIASMTARDNVALPLQLGHYDHIYERADEALNAVGLGHRLHHFPSQLSGGEQQRVALARAYIAQPKLILADEPTGNLDQDTGQKVIESLFSMAEKAGSALLLITHDQALAKRCQRTIKMADGCIL